MPSQSTGSSHLGSVETAAYVDGVLLPEEADRVEEHLADCDACRAEVKESRRILHHPAAGRRRWFLLGPATVAAAAGLGAILLFRTAGEIASSPGAADSDLQPIEVVAPSGIVAPDSIVFVWNSVAPGADYRVGLSAEDGRDVWSATTADTALVLPRTTVLAPSTVYIWHVDARLPDGRTATTGTRRFAIGP